MNDPRARKRAFTNTTYFSPGAEPLKPRSPVECCFIELGVVVSACLALSPTFWAIVTIVTWSPKDWWVSAFKLLFNLTATGLLLWLAIHLNSMLMASAEKKFYCECCGGHGPTLKTRLYRLIGAVVLMFSKSVKGHFCKKCVSRWFWDFTGITFFFGWWGFLPFLITPIVLINNVIVYVRSLLLDASPPTPEPTREMIPRTRVL